MLVGKELREELHCLSFDAVPSKISHAENYHILRMTFLATQPRLTFPALHCYCKPASHRTAPGKIRYKTLSHRDHCIA